MKTKYFILAAIAGMTFASCSNDEFIGDTSPTLGAEGDGSIQFSYSVANTTRANHVGADAASLLNKKFIVGGFKGAGDVTSTVVATGTVFDNYIVNWTANTAGKTASNTSDWEYAGITAAAPSGIAGNTQSIKYWDYSAAQYDFIAYSTGTATVTTTLAGTDADEDAAINRAITNNLVHVTAVNPTNAKTAAYKLSGKAAELAKCYIADMVTAYNPADYKKEVKLTFRSLATKVRMAIYETVPGYSVKDVKFYTNASTTIATGTSNTDATLFTTGSAAKDHFYTAGTCTVKFPTVGSTNTSATDYNKAHASFSVVGEGKSTTQAFGTLNKVGREYKEAVATDYIGRTATTASFAGTSDYYQIVMPNEEGAVLELRVDYTLLSTDGSGEEIKVHGATAFVPAVYSQWKSNYAYTYIFKISDNTNGWTSIDSDDPAGLYPITFDAIVLDTEDGTQSTITTVSTPAITTYQKGHAYNDGTPNDDYKTGKPIYVMVQDADLKDDLNTKGQLYTVTGSNISEATVMDALNIQVSATGSPFVITGRNGIALTEVASTLVKEIDASDSPDGNAVPVTRKYVLTEQPTGWPTDYYTDEACTTEATGSFPVGGGTYYRKNTAVKFTPSASTIYAYAYKVDDKDDSYIYSAEALTAKPDDWETVGLWYTDPDGVTAINSGSGATTYADGTYYKKYTNLNKVYAVKVIRVK